MSTPARWLRRARPNGTTRGTPRGLVSVAVGLLVYGATTYGFLVVTARALGPERFLSVQVLWALTFLAALGFFVPLEQQVTRALAARRAAALAGSPIVRQGAALGGMVLVALLLATAALSPLLLRYLFDRQSVLLCGFALALVGYAAVHLARGVLAGAQRFTAYGVVMAVEGVLRVGGCVVLAVAGVRTPGPYGLTIGLSPVTMAGALFLLRSFGREPATSAPLGELSRGLGHLVAGALLVQVLLNGPAIEVKLLGSAADQEAAGRFLAGLVLARVPLFLFAAIQAVALPKLTSLVVRGRLDAFRAALRRLLAGLSGVCVAAALAAVAAGPAVLRVVFGAPFRLGAPDLVVLTVASFGYLTALVLAQALVALSGQARIVPAWLAAVVAFAACALLPGALITRVELGYLAGAVVAVCSMAALVRSRLAHVSSSWRDAAAVTPPITAEPIA